MTVSEALDIRSLDVSFGSGRSRLQVLRDVSLTVPFGSTVALVGESGSGKSTLAKAVVGAVTPDSGDILIAGAQIGGRSRRDVAALRRSVQLVPQDPYASLDPRMTVGDAIAEAIDPARGSLRARRGEVDALLESVSMDPDAAGHLPHRFSGGQRQRIAIARALAVEPTLLIADEITSALDCSVQAEILGVLAGLKATRQVSMLFISHDLAVVRHVADEVAVMERGVIVERARRAELFTAPRHEYTRELIASVPSL